VVAALAHMAMQQTGMPFIIMQQVQPGIIMAVMQSQQAWIVLTMFASPLVQVIMTPMSIISHLQAPMQPMLQEQQVMPFIIMQHEHMAFGIIMQRFWSMAADTLSSHTQLICMPSAVFVIVIVQRGIIIMPGMPMPIPDIMGDMPV
jgi:hypothetical protein